MQEEEEEEMNRETNVVDIDIRLTKSVSQRDRQLLHPLELNDKLAFETIKTVRLDFLTGEAVPPIPRCQALASHAFSRLTGRSILVALSHGWFFQTHPDPDGEKLNLIKNRFAPALRERYPNTDIQVFFDYLASPQRPRTAEEDKIFAIAMDRMNSMYVYADVTIFLEIKLPVLDMKIRTATNVDLSKYKFFDFVDTVQVSETSSKTGPQQFDCIQTCDDVDVKSTEFLHKNKSTSVILTYLHRPFGRPNTIINDERGWLFLERITIAIKAAATEKALFDDIVVSNSESLRLQIYKWSERLRDAASKQETEPKALRDVLDHFDNVLQTKRFSFRSDEDVVRKLMKKLINQFADDWNGEVAKQVSMGKRAREILLRWGCFSEEYVKRAGFLRDDHISTSDITRFFIQCIGIVIIGPGISIVPYLFLFMDKPRCTLSDFLFLLAFIDINGCVPGALLGAAYTYSFLGIPLQSLHHVLQYMNSMLVGACVITIILVVCGVTMGTFVVPLYTFWGLFTHLFVVHPIVEKKCKFITVTHPRNGQSVRLTLGSYSVVPRELLLDPKVGASLNRLASTSVVTILFALACTFFFILRSPFDVSHVYSLFFSTLGRSNFIRSVFSFRSYHSVMYCDYFLRDEINVRAFHRQCHK